jgi:hypothetical protein
MENYLHEMSLEQYHLLFVAGLVLNSKVFGFACKWLVVPTSDDGGGGQI